MSPEQLLPLRPHHGMCLAYFKGEGYSTGFTGHMQSVLDQLEQGAVVKLCCGVDEICSACPHRDGKRCAAGEMSLRYDEQVLKRCGLSDGEILPFDAFVRLVETNILSPGQRESICGDCRWNDLCSTQKSRWQTTSE
ncbi:MAG: DUF1284 domain-containing protein [Oscillospiraceae bacterium]|nr:DUF1284 domain-containing protein [Oscillospiraceae bacterium]